MDVIERIAATDATVLLVGERGVEQNRVARLIHELSPRRDRPLEQVNCSSLPPHRLERELFGTDQLRGGAGVAHAGRLLHAAGGSLFLDEVSELPLALQGQLLQVLQERHVPRPASGRDIAVDVRVIAATNRDLKALVERHAFREDLYYRLNVLRIYVPPLRERRDELAEMVKRIVARYARRHGRSPRPVSPATMQLLMEHTWPGNVGELENILERMVVLATDDWVGGELAASRAASASRQPAARVPGLRVLGGNA